MGLTDDVRFALLELVAPYAAAAASPALNATSAAASLIRFAAKTDPVNYQIDDKSPACGAGNGCSPGGMIPNNVCQEQCNRRPVREPVPEW